MKQNIRYIISLFACLFTETGLAQINTPTSTATPVSATPVALPSTYTTSAGNFIRTWQPKYPQTTVPTVIATTNTPQQVAQITQYLDGLGRPVQTVGKGLSPAGADVVSTKVYDSYGREQYSYLPYTQTGVSDGNFKTAPFSSQSSYYNNATLNPGIAGDKIFYGQQKLESSPLNRVLKAYSPGNSWAAEGGNKPVEAQYLQNTVGNGVRIWNIPVGGGTPQSLAAYLPGQLSRSVLFDEQRHRIEEFKNKDGQIVLKKISLTSVLDDHVGWLCTYYVYDSIGNLRCVIPPKAVDSIRNNWAISTTVYNELCFSYTYDGRRRMTTKKVPGAAAVEMVYDVRDRIVYSRDGNLKTQGKWMVIYYDDLNRQVETALYAGTEAQATLQNQLTSSGTLNPPISTGLLTPLTYTYYDNYTYTGVKSSVAAELSKPQNNGNVYADGSTLSTMTKGLVTGKKELILGTSQWLITSIYYDNKARTLQTISDNAKGGTITTSNLYDFSNKLLSTYVHQTNPASTLTPDLKILTMIHYNSAGLVDSISNIVNDDPSTRRLLVTNSYDELGRIKKTILANIESQTFEYNVKGWMSSMNKDYVNGVSNSQTHFGEILSYDRGFSQSQFNGNVAGAIWRDFNDGAVRAYGFGYDTSGRLTKADFNQQVSGNVWSQSSVNFSVSGLTYDANGNISTLTQKGLKGTQSATIDSLVYKYSPVSNKLKFVTDRANDPVSVLGDFKETAQNKSLNVLDSADYTYDQNGNLTSDGNKGITGISYNFLNLPDQVSFKGKGLIKFLYDANGHKLRKTVIDSTQSTVKTTVIEYLNGMIFQNDSLQFLLHPAGRIRAKIYSGQPVKYVYDYFVRDHLGNTRQVLTEESDTATYVATMEAPVASAENSLFSNIDASRANAPAGFKSDNLTNPDNSVAALNAAQNKKIGPSLVLRVMAGDTIQAGVAAFFKSGADVRKRFNYGAQMVATLVQALNGSTTQGDHASSYNILPTGTVLDSSVYNNIVQNSPDWDGKPKAYLNYILFDDQMQLQDVSGARQVPNTPDEPLQLGSGEIVAPKSGFAYIYVSNESAQEVDFNNLAIVHKTGPLLEEIHYYPFGLAMEGISSNALKGTTYPVNKRRFGGKELQSKEFSDGSGLEWYDYGARFHDPQIGRWSAIDPKADKMTDYSPYNYSLNNPLRYADTDGKEPEDFVRDNSTGRIRWDNNANSQATTKAGETYLGKTLTFTFNSFIDAKLWDGPMGSIPAGDKLTTTIKVTGNENGKGALTSVTATKSVKLGHTPIGTVAIPKNRAA